LRKKPGMAPGGGDLAPDVTRLRDQCE